MNGIKLKTRFSSKRAAVAGAATLIGLGLIAGGGYSAWDTTKDAPNSGTVTAATVTLDAVENPTMTDQWTANLDNALPGASKAGYLDVSNTGTTDLTVAGTLKADTKSNGLEGALTLKVIESTTAFDDQAHVPGDETVIYDTATVDQTGVNTDLGKIAPNTKVYLKIVTTLPSDADATYQSQKAAYDYGFVGTTA